MNKIRNPAMTTTTIMIVMFGAAAEAALYCAEAPTETPFDVATTGRPVSIPAVDKPHFPIEFNMEEAFPAPPSPQQQEMF
jgi:hypothetical protein